MIQSETAVIATEGSRRFDGHFARPQTGRGPGLLIFSEMWGVAEKKRELADDYARRGWCAIAPNMFWRSEFTGVVPFDEADKAWTRLQAFDFDGRIAFLAAARAGIDAAIGLYALGIAKHLDEVRGMAVPLQLHYGLSDEHIPKSEIDTVAAAAAGNANIEIQLYPDAGHGFFNRARLPGDEKAIEAATAHIDRFLGRFK
jgi:carboxymethylenebutenolidase